ncbi:MAG: AAA family ATPase [Alphaproteobacteria bacterium]|nr:AAA family ATPase [Alphaproteobacteria bacterium]
MIEKMKKANEPIQEETLVIQPTKDLVEKNKRLEELELLRITTQTVLPPEKASISIDGVPFFEIGDIGAVKAKQKAGKTTMLKTLCGAWMNGSLFRLKSEVKGTKVLWLDTEQKRQDVKKIIDDVKQLSGKSNAFINGHLKLYTVRTLSYKTLMDDTKLLVSTYHPHVLIIDGLVDYIESFNDEAMSHQLINELVMLSEKYNCAIITVLHENKSDADHNMRGHLGTMLAQKAGTVLKCAKDGNDVITVSCSDSRHAAMPSWKIKFDESGHIVSADGPQTTPNQIEEARRVNIIKEIIQDNGGSIPRKELTGKLEEKLKLSRQRVTNFITEQINKETICEADKKIQIQSELV